MVSFGTSGIRDRSPSIVSPSLAMEVGRLVGAKTKTLVVGYDGRRTGPMLKSALSAGAAGMGAQVLDLGLCATPTLAWWCEQQQAAGAMITASHNPPEYNGIKLFLDGKEMPKEEERRIEEALAKNRLPACADWQKAGSIPDSSLEARQAHLHLLLSKIDLKQVAARRPKVVVDCANSAACALMPSALRAAGCEVEVLNGTPGEPYGRALEPNEKSLAGLSKSVLSFRADLGIAHDGDADRAIVVDEKGRMIGLDVQLAMVVKEQIKAKGTIVSTVESSLALRELVEKAGAKLDITPVGSLQVASRMRETHALFGGEPCGEYLFSGGAGVPDGLMAGLYFVAMFCKNGKLSEQAGRIARYPVSREKIPCPDSKKERAMAAILKRWPFPPPSRLDGVRTDFSDGWVLVRPSGTEPYIRITAEAKNEKALAAYLPPIRSVVQAACR